MAAADARRGHCAPNPAVGAVVVSVDGEHIATGCHWACGHAHAEVDALQKAGAAAKGAVLYVTLEPCNHTGKTPPCTRAIKKAGISQVFYGYSDPNPQVAGSGAQALREAGIACELLENVELNGFYRSYTYWLATGKPRLIAKLAQSKDGFVAHADGRPAAISGVEAAAYTAEGRRRADAVLTTVQTVIADNPRLNCRLPDRVESRPVYVLDSRLRFPADAQLLQTAKEVVLLHASESATHDKLRCVAVAGEEGALDWCSIADALGKEGLHEVWVETGPRAFQSLLQSGEFAEAIIYESDKSLDSGLSGVSRLHPALQAATLSQFMLGADSMYRHSKKPL